MSLVNWTWDAFCETNKTTSSGGSNFLQAERYHIWMNHEPQLMSYSFKSVLRCRSSSFSWVEEKKFINQAEIECVRLHYMTADRANCNSTPKLTIKKILVPKTTLSPPYEIESASRFPAEFGKKTIAHPDLGSLMARTAPGNIRVAASLSSEGGVSLFHYFLNSTGLTRIKPGNLITDDCCKQPSLNWLRVRESEVYLVTTNPYCGLNVFDMGRLGATSNFSTLPSKFPKRHEDCILSIDFNKNHNAVTISSNGMITIHDLFKESIIASMQSNTMLESVACHPAYDNIIVTGDVEQTLKVWDIRSLRPLSVERTTNGIPKCIRFSPHRNELMAVGTDKGQILLALFGKYFLNDKIDVANTNTIPGAVFVHSGHTGGMVEDLNFHPNIMGMIGSTDSHNQVLIWKPRKLIDY